MDYGIYKITTAPTSGSEVSLNDLKDFLRISTSDTGEDNLLRGFITTASSMIEADTGLTFFTTTFEARFVNFSSFPIQLHRGPCSTINSVSYIDSDGATQALVEGTDFIVDSTSSFYRIKLHSNFSIPSVDVNKFHTIVVNFDAGYGSINTAIPRDLRHAIMLLCSHFYENRSASMAGSLTEIPFGVKAILAQYKSPTFLF